MSKLRCVSNGFTNGVLNSYINVKNIIMSPVRIPLPQPLPYTHSYKSRSDRYLLSDFPYIIYRKDRLLSHRQNLLARPHYFHYVCNHNTNNCCIQQIVVIFPKKVFWKADPENPSALQSVFSMISPMSQNPHHY